MIEGLIEEQPQKILRCYYCNEFTYSEDKFIRHLDWHHFLATIGEGDDRLPYQRIVKDTVYITTFNNDIGISLRFRIN